MGLKTRFLILNVLAALVTAMGARAQESAAARIEGVVLLAGSRMPVEKARVVLSSWLAGQPPRETLTNRNGLFVFDRVPASAIPYGVRVEREGYRLLEVAVRTDDPGSSATVSGALTLEVKADGRYHAEFQLTTAGVIAGVISDHEGQPAAGASVELITANGTEFMPIAKRVGADSEGNYRFDEVLPGDYRVEASLARYGPIYSVRGAHRNALVPNPLSVTYYPGVASASFAGLVTVKPGSQLLAVDFRLAKPSPLRIAGRIENRLRFDDSTFDSYRRSGGNPEGFGADNTASYSFFVVPKDKPAAEATAIGPLPDYDDDPYRFELRHIPPGNYDVWAKFTPNTGDGYIWHSYIGYNTVRLVDRDVADAVIPIERNAELTGRVIRHESVPKPDRSRSEGVPDLTPVEPISDVIHLNSRLQRPSPVQADGSFRIPGGVPPGRYWASIMEHTLPSGTYLAAARLDGADVFGIPFTIAGGSKHELVFELRGDGGQLQGAVSDNNRRKFADASVVLVPPDHRRDDPSAYMTIATDARGEYTLDRIRPDTYTILAFPKRIEFDLLRSPAFVARYLTQGRNVVVEKGKKVRMDLPPVSFP
jgi:hypothetical protein